MTIDLTGQKIGMIAVLSRTEKPSANGQVRWNCLCDCGRGFISTGSGLIQRKHKNCGHQEHQNIAKQSPTAIKPGDKFGYLTVIQYQQSDKNYNAMWLCQCDCGNQTLVRTQALRNGRTKSCGCHKAPPPKQGRNGKFVSKNEGLAGQRFNYLAVIEVDKSRKEGYKYWLCQCDCETIKSIKATDLVNGYVRSCGCKRRELWKESSPTYKGGRTISHGYVWLSGYQSHPNANPQGGIAEHVLVMSQILGRPLIKGESVHHKNGIRDDNRPENLELWVKRQPSGQRVIDRIVDALGILKLYAPHLINEDAATEFNCINPITKELIE